MKKTTYWIGTLFLLVGAHPIPNIMPLIVFINVMTSSNGSIFRVTNPLWGVPPVTGGFPSQRAVTLSFDVFFDLRLNKRLSKKIRTQVIWDAISLIMMSL